MTRPISKNGLMLSPLRIACTILLGSQFSAVPCAAQEVANAPIDTTSFLAARVDVEQFNLTLTLEFLHDVAPQLVSKETAGGIRGFAAPVLDALRQNAEASELLVCLSTLDLPTGMPSVLIATDQPEAAAEAVGMVTGWLPPAAGYQVHQRPGYTIACTDRAWQRIESAEQRRPELVEALRRAGDAPLSITLAFSESLAMSVADLWPDRLPTISPVKLSPKLLMEGVQSVTLKLWSKPEPRVDLVVECRNAQSAIEVRSEIDLILEQLGINLESVDAVQSQVVYSAEGGQLQQTLMSLFQSGQASADRQQAANDLKQIILGLHTFYARYDAILPRMTVSPEGQPLLSWRVHILPFIDQAELYEQFHLDEPWDSPHNIKLVEQIPQVFRTAGGPGVELGRTCIVAPMTEDSYWSGKSTEWQTFRVLSDTTDTICFVVAPPGRAVVWTQPDDLPLDANELIGDLFDGREDVLVARFNGSVIRLPSSIGAERLKAELTHASGD